MQASRNVLPLFALLLSLSCGDRGMNSTTDAPPEGSPAPEVVETTLPQARDSFDPEALRKEVETRTLRGTPSLPAGLPVIDLNVAIDPRLMTYQGTMLLQTTNRSNEEWTELHFHLFPNSSGVSGTLYSLVVDEASVAGEPVTVRETRDHLALPLKEPLSPGNSLVAELKFRGVIPRGNIHQTGPGMNPVGLLASMFGQEEPDYGVLAYSSGVLSLALWYPVPASYDDSGWDQGSPGTIGDFSYFDPAFYRVTIDLPENYQIATTGEFLFRKDGKRVYGAAAAREFAILASANLTHQSRQVRLALPITVNSYSFPADSVTGKKVLDQACEALRVYEDRFGPYPYNELDVVEMDLKGGAGGVEFPGLVTIASFLYTDSWGKDYPDASDVLKSRYLTESLEFVVVHEVAHQWWSGIVGSHSRLHPFMDEALANYSSILYFKEHKGEEAARRQTLLQLEFPFQLHRWMGGADFPVDRPAADFPGLMAYSAVVYGKGALYLSKVHDAMGDDRFFKALSDYVAEFSFATATPEDLQRHLQENAPDRQQIHVLEGRWLQGTQGDLDIGRLDPTRLVPVLLTEMNIPMSPWLEDTLGDEGFWEGVRLVSNIVVGEEDWFKGVSLQKLMSWGARMARKLLVEILI